jgi:hypothetical protein
MPVFKGNSAFRKKMEHEWRMKQKKLAKNASQTSAAA